MHAWLYIFLTHTELREIPVFHYLPYNKPRRYSYTETVHYYEIHVNTAYIKALFYAFFFNAIYKFTPLLTSVS
jgi:hypothetical protein